MDIGGESTRPGADPVSVEEELRRVVPVLEALAGLPVSIDTAKAEVARRALALGAELVNDVTALRGDPELAGVVADADAYRLPDAHAGRASDDAARPPLRRRRRGRDGIPGGAAGVRGRGRVSDEDRVCLDPGFGFGKTPDQNLQLLQGLDALVAIGRPVLVGLSRKSTIGRGARRSGGPRRQRRRLRGRGGGGVRPRRVDLPRPRRRVRTSRRSRSRRPSSGAASRDGRSARDRARGLPRRARGGAAPGTAVPRRRLARAGRASRPPRATRSRTPSTTATWSRSCGRSRRARAYHLLEALAAAIADRLVGGLPVTSVRVRVRKPDVELALPVEHAAVIVER